MILNYDIVARTYKYSNSVSGKKFLFRRLFDALLAYITQFDALDCVYSCVDRFGSVML